MRAGSRCRPAACRPGSRSRRARRPSAAPSRRRPRSATSSAPASMALAARFGAFGTWAPRTRAARTHRLRRAPPVADPDRHRRVFLRCASTATRSATSVRYPLALWITPRPTGRRPPGLRTAGGAVDHRRCERRMNLALDRTAPVARWRHGGARQAADLPRRGTGRRQDVRDARRGAPAASSAAPTSSSGSSRRTAGRAPRSCCDGLEVLPRREVDYRGARLRPSWTSTPCWPARPQVALVDELAHTNVPGVRATPSAGRTSRSCSAAGHRRHHHRQRPAPGVAQRRGRDDHRGAAAGDRARRGGARAPTRSSWSTCRPEALRRRMAHGNVYPAGQGRRRAGQLLPGRQPHRAARAGPAVAGRTGSTSSSTAYRGRARHRRDLGDPRAGRRRAHRRPRGRHADPPGRPDRRPRQPAASCSPCTSPAPTG